MQMCPVVVEVLGLKKSVVYILVHTVTLPSNVIADAQHYPDYMKRPNEERWGDFGSHRCSNPTPFEILKQYV